MVRVFFFSTGGAKFSNTERTIIFIHGAGMDRTVWSMQARFFAHHGFTIVNLDLPGHGKSEGPACTTIEEYSNWLCELIDFWIYIMFLWLVTRWAHL